MKEEIRAVIKKMERAQDMLYNGRVSEANTLIYEAQSELQFILDNRL